MTLHSALIPRSRMMGTRRFRISATPPPSRVELTCRNRRPCTRSARWSRKSTVPLGATFLYGSIEFTSLALMSVGPSAELGLDEAQRLVPDLLQPAQEGVDAADSAGERVQAQLLTDPVGE